jgi:hypothetical protein
LKVNTFDILLSSKLVVISDEEHKQFLFCHSKVCNGQESIYFT